MYIYIYIYIYVDIYIYVYIYVCRYIYIDMYMEGREGGPESRLHGSAHQGKTRAANRDFVFQFPLDYNHMQCQTWNGVMKSSS